MDVYPKTAPPDEGGHFYMTIKVGNCMRGGVMSLMVTSGGTYRFLVGNWNTRYCPSGLPRTREGTRANGLMGDHRYDGH